MKKSTLLRDEGRQADGVDPQQRPVRIVIGHPSALTRLGFAELVKHLAGAELCASVATVAHTIGAMKEHRPDLLVIDQDFRAAVVKTARTTRVLLISPHDHAAQTDGCEYTCAFTSERESVESLVDTLQQVLACTESRTSSSRCVTCPLQPSLAPASLPLSEREQQVFDLIAAGWVTGKIARALGLSVKTVETYRENIKLKLGLASSTELTEAALLWRRGMWFPHAAMPQC